MITKDRKKTYLEKIISPRTKTSWFKMLLNPTSLIVLLIALVHSVHVITSAKVEVPKKKKARTKQLLIPLASTPIFI